MVQQSKRDQVRLEQFFVQLGQVLIVVDFVRVVVLSHHLLQQSLLDHDPLMVELGYWQLYHPIVDPIFVSCLIFSVPPNHQIHAVLLLHFLVVVPQRQQQLLFSLHFSASHPPMPSLLPQLSPSPTVLLLPAPLSVFAL
jgi:hypothetical protein